MEQLGEEQTATTSAVQEPGELIPPQPPKEQRPKRRRRQGKITEYTVAPKGSPPEPVGTGRHATRETCKLSTHEGFEKDQNQRMKDDRTKKLL